MVDLFNQKIHKKVLLVEGPTDEEIINSLMHKYNCKIPALGIKICRGKEGVKKSLSSLLKNYDIPNYIQAIGAVVDSDSDSCDTYKDVQNIITSFSYPHKKLPKEGLIVPGGHNRPKLGIWLMPNNRNEGNLENFCLNLISEQNKEYLFYLKEKIKDLKEEGHAFYKDIHSSKALLYTYLALQNKPGNSLGLSIIRGNIPAFSSLADSFILWVKNLMKH